MSRINNTYLPLIYETALSNSVEKFFRQQYHLITPDHEEVYYNDWLDRWVELYQKYHHYDFSDLDSIANGCAECLEELIKNG